ncbi:hypothetical protein AB0M92_36685 [Streptomyces sp. NPDC051582]|uniref:hypothetical protein n=1 Tax=Streptomyces sp. NPDC051582 TaxID=3155167 RepID=UPI00342F12FD
MEFEAGIHQAKAAEVEPLLRAWAGSGVRVFEVDTGDTVEKAAVILSLAGVLPTEPPACGQSWEAFEDSLWEGIFQLKEPRVAIALRGRHWTNQPYGAVQMVLDILEHVVEVLGDEKATVGRPTKLCVLLAGDC